MAWLPDFEGKKQFRPLTRNMLHVLNLNTMVTSTPFVRTSNSVLNKNKYKKSLIEIYLRNKKKKLFQHILLATVGLFLHILTQHNKNEILNNDW
jgi:hypothetical protein